MGVALAQVVVAFGVVAAGVWIMGKLLDRTAEKERQEIWSTEDDDDRLVNR